MADLETRPNEAGVDAFLARIQDDDRRKDCLTLLELMRQVTETEARMWGTSIVGFGSYHYKYASGLEGDWFLTGFAPRKHELTLYNMAGFDRYEDLRTRLGKHQTGKSCLYIKRLAEIDVGVLRRLVTESVGHLRRTYG
jgi:uncharacterized protein DUF1801